MNNQIPTKVKANQDNDLLFRTSMMTEEEKRKKEELMKEAANRQNPTKIEYFTE